MANFPTDGELHDEDEDEDENPLLDDDADDSDDDEEAPDDDSDDESDDSDDPIADLKAEVAELRDEIARSKATQAGNQRSLGQIKSLQSKIDRLTNSAADRTSVEETGELLGALSEALSTVMDSADPAYARVAAIQAKRERDAAVRKAIQDAKDDADGGDEPDDDGTGNQMSAEDQAAWNTASGTVNGYAKAKGVAIDREFLVGVYNDSMGLPEKAVDLAMERIDALASNSGGRQDSRRRRKAAGQNGTGAPKGGGGGKRGRLSMDDLKGMSEEQILKLDPEVVDRALASGR